MAGCTVSGFSAEMPSLGNNVDQRNGRSFLIVPGRGVLSQPETKCYQYHPYRHTDDGKYRTNGKIAVEGDDSIQLYTQC